MIGLNNLLAAHTDQTTCEESVCTGLTTPQDLWSIYGQPTKISNPDADFGQGQTMAVLGEGAVSGVISDLRAFEAEHHLPQIRINIDSVGDDFQDTSGSGEWDIDTQASTGMSPKALDKSCTSRRTSQIRLFSPTSVRGVLTRTAPTRRTHPSESVRRIRQVP